MSRSWATLPVEILALIFSIVEDLENEIPIQYVCRNTSPIVEDLESKNQCQYVCKGWLLPAQIQRFKQVKIRWDTVLRFSRIMEEFSPEIGEYIQTVDILYDRKEFENYLGCFLQFSRFCPNLKVLKFFSKRNELWPRLLEVVQLGYWPKLQIIPPLENVHNLTSYINTVLKCPKLEELTLLLWDDIFDEYDELEEYDLDEYQLEKNQENIKKLAKNFKSFKFLKKLSIETFNTFSDISKLESTIKIEDCPSLNSLSLNSSSMIANPNPVHETIDFARIKPTANILSFVGDVVMTKNTLKYLSYKFPGLNNLTLNLDAIHYFSSQQQHNEEVNASSRFAIDKFFEYVSKIRKTYLVFINISNLSYLITRYFRSPICCHKKIKLNFDSVFKLTDTTSSILFETGCKMNAKLWGEEINVAEIRVNPAKNLTDLEVIKSVGTDIEVLHLSTNRRGTEETRELALVQNMKEAFRNCNSLKTLILTNALLLNIGNISNQSLEKVVLDIKFYKERETIIDAKHLPGLKYISVISQMIKEEELIQSSYYFSIKLPSNDIENISWDFSVNGFAAFEARLSIIHLWINYSNDREECYIYDSSGLRKAIESDLLYFDFSDNYNDHYDRCCIRVFCKSLKSITFDIPTSSTHVYTTFLLNKYAD